MRTIVSTSADRYTNLRGSLIGERYQQWVMYLLVLHDQRELMIPEDEGKSNNIVLTTIIVEKNNSGEFAAPEKIFCQSGKPHGIRGSSGQHISHLT